MRHTLLFLFLFASLPLAALELGATFDLSNLEFDNDRPVTATSLPGDSYLWGLSMTGAENLNADTTVELVYQNDPVLRQIVYTRLQYTDQFFRISVGPFFGLLNAPDTLLQSGLSTTVELFAPGLARIGLRSDTSLSGRLVVAGDYIQERSELSVGFYVPNALPTLYIRSKRYTYKTSTGENVDSLTAYGLETDVFQKNIPYHVTLDFAFQSRSLAFVAGSTTTHAYGAIVLGTDIRAQVTESLSVHLDLESSIYTFGTEFLVGTVNTESFLFRARLGASVIL